MSRQQEIIVLDDSSDSDSEAELRSALTLTTYRGKAPVKKSAVFGDYVLSREERYLLAVDEDDESDASVDDDDYDDRDDSFGDGARAFAHKRQRPTSHTSSATKRQKTPPSTPTKARRSTPMPTPTHRPTSTPTSSRGRGRGNHSDNEEGEEDDDQPFRHSSMVRKMEKSRMLRKQLNGKPEPTLTKQPPPVRREKDDQLAREETKERAKKIISQTQIRRDTKPLAARKSATLIKGKVMRPAPAKRSEDSDEYKDDDVSSEEESEEDSVGDESEEEEEESDGSAICRRRWRKPTEEIELSEEDSGSRSSDADLDEPDSEEEEEVSSTRHSPPAKKSYRGIAKRGVMQTASKKKPPQNKPESTLPPKPKPRPRETPPLPPPHRPSPPQPTSAASAPPRPRRDSTLASRSSRAVAALPENMSIEDMQVQERQLAYFKQQQKRRDLSSQPSATSQSLARNRPSSSGAEAANGARKSVTTQNLHRLKRHDSAASISSSVSSVPSREPKPLARTRAPAPFVPPALREGFSATGTRHVVTTVSVAQDASTLFAAVENVDHIPLPHNTWWRERLQFVRAPLNILPPEPHSSSWLAFSQVKERALCEFDDSGTVAPLADLASPPKVSTNELLTQSFESQEIINQRVRRVIDTSLPVLKQCHRRRVQDMVLEMRKLLPWSSPNAGRSLTGLGGRRSLPRSVEASPSPDMAPIEHVHAKRILHASLPRAKSKLPNRLVGTIHYVLGFPRTRRDTAVEAGEGDIQDQVYEIPHFPETIIEFGEDLAPMRRACAWIGVKTNVHVDDDPILRYIPYLGDKDRVNIDPRRYNATTLDKQRAITVELPEDESASEEDAVKTQERLDCWRSDVANLVHATRSASEDEVMEYLLCMVIKQCGRSDKVIQALREVGGFAEPITDYGVIQKREDTARSIGKRLHDLRQCLKSVNTPPSSSSIHDALIHKYVFLLVGTSTIPLDDDPSVGQKLRPPLASFASNYLQRPASKGLRDVKSVGQVMECYRDLFCRRCFTYDCQQHGIQHPQPSHRMDPLNPVVKKSGVGLTRAKKAMGNEDNAVIEIASSSSSSSDESEVEEEIDDAQSTLSGSVDGEGDAAEGEVDKNRRRSGRSQTRASTMASASLKVQEVMVEKERRKLQRKQSKQLRKLVRQVDDSEYLDDSYQDIVGPILDMLISPGAKALCGASCWKNSASASDELSKASLSEVARLMVRKFRPILGDNACLIAWLLQDPTMTHLQPIDGTDTDMSIDSCTAIHHYIAEQKQNALDTDNASTSTSVYDDSFHDKTGHRRQYRSSAALHSGNRELIKRTRMNRAQQQTKERDHRYEPCNHHGACAAGSCDCLKRAHDCDKACSCARDCLNRHQGCKCAPGQCRKKGCLCYDAARECDPDYCFSCGAHEAAVMAFDETQRHILACDVGICQNVSLLRGVHKKIGVAFSAIHGWGAYTLEPIRKGEFVYEYTGALISDDEAERRGNIYDALKVSFLFDVNSDEVVDAMRKGNKIKFANHRTRELANLDTKILIVRGEHRIALYAKWDLHVGEELFFDYGYTNETAPEWSQLHTPHNSKYAGSDLDDDDEGEELEEVLRLQTHRDDDDDEL